MTELRLISAAHIPQPMCNCRQVPQPSSQIGQQTQAVLSLAYRTAAQMVNLYVEQMFEARHQRQPRLDTALGCRLGGSALPGKLAEALLPACNSIGLSFAWNEVELPLKGLEEV